MRYAKATTGLVLMVLLLAGCFGAAPIRPALGPEYAVAYGNISLPENKYITGTDSSL